MADPISFTAATPRFSLPFLFAGQAQKEFYVNQAQARIDALLHPVVEGTAAAPPATPQEGQAWLVGAEATGAWQGQGGTIAAFAAGTWLFITPRNGMQVFDISAAQYARFANGWHRAAAPAAPVGGAVADAEARAAIAQLIEALASAGILPDV